MKVKFRWHYATHYVGDSLTIFWETGEQFFNLLNWDYRVLNLVKEVTNSHVSRSCSLTPSPGLLALQTAPWQMLSWTLPGSMSLENTHLFSMVAILLPNPICPLQGSSWIFFPPSSFILLPFTPACLSPRVTHCLLTQVYLQLESMHCWSRA